MGSSVSDSQATVTGLVLRAPAASSGKAVWLALDIFGATLLQRWQGDHQPGNSWLRVPSQEPIQRAPSLWEDRHRWAAAGA